MGDLFPDRLDRCRRTLTDAQRPFGSGKLGDKVKVTNETCFTGWDAHKKVLATGVNLVILTEPPYFRPSHLRAAPDAQRRVAPRAGKHVFAEKPLAVDPVGVRSVIETARRADAKGLTIVVGTQGRRMMHLIEGMKRIHNGDLGEIVGGQCVRIGDGMLTWSEATRQRQPGWSDMEWQLRRWLFLTWLSGDFIIEGDKPFKYDGPQPSPVLQQHADQIAAIRSGGRLNEAVRAAESTRTCIMGRMSAYTGRALKWDWVMQASKLDLSPAKEAFGDLPMRPVAVPGQTPLV